MMKNILGRKFGHLAAVLLSLCSGLYVSHSLMSSACEQKELALFLKSLPIALESNKAFPLLAIVLDYEPHVLTEIACLNDPTEIVWSYSFMKSNEVANSMTVMYSPRKIFNPLSWGIRQGNDFRNPRGSSFKVSDLQDAQNALYKKQNFELKSLDERYIYRICGQESLFKSPCIKVIEQVVLTSKDICEKHPRS